MDMDISETGEDAGGAGSWARHILGEIQGFFYGERVKSFKVNGWPHVDPTRHLCTAEELALAGFYWCDIEDALGDSDPVGKCWACGVEICIDDFGPVTDPWDLHSVRSEDCPYIELGKKMHPGDYTFMENFAIAIGILGQSVAHSEVSLGEELQNAIVDQDRHLLSVMAEN